MTKADKKFSKRINQRFAKKQNEMRRESGVFGDGGGQLNVPGLDGFNYVTIGDKALPVFNNRVAAQIGVKVWVGYAPEEPTLFQVLATRSETPAGVAVGFTGYAPGKRYEWNAEGGGQDPLKVHLRAITFLKIGVSETGGMNVDLYRGNVWSGSEYIEIVRQDIDVSAHIPTTPDMAALVMISIDNTGAVIQTKGDEKDIYTLVRSDRPAVPANTVWVSGCVRVYYGQTAVQEARSNTDFDDLRFSGSTAFLPKLDDLATPDDNTDLNASTARHGLMPKLSGISTEYLDGDGNFTIPSDLIITDGGIARGAKVRNNGDITIPNDQTPSEILTYNTVMEDTGSFFDISDPDRLTIHADGWHVIAGSFMYDANATGQREIFFKMNDALTTIAVDLINATSGGFRTRMAIAACHYFVAGDYVVMGAYQNSGGSLDIDGSSIQSPTFAIVAISAPLFSLDTDTDAILTLIDNVLGLQVQAANMVFAGPTTGSPASPSFRALVTADIPGGSQSAAELLMQDGVSSPPVPIENESGSDWLYQG